jgi:hypothetical protein
MPRLGTEIDVDSSCNPAISVLCNAAIRIIAAPEY